MFWSWHINFLTIFRLALYINNYIVTCASPCRNLRVAMVPLVNTLKPRHDGRYFADDVLKCIFLNENVWISLKIALKFVPGGPINNIPALVQIMAWRRPGDKPLSEPMLVLVPTHICVTRPQWVNVSHAYLYISIILGMCIQHVWD